MATFKEELLDYCRFVVQRKIELIAYSMDELTVSMQSETKSSVGDKHETARARMQFEQEKLAKQLADLKAQLKELERFDASKTSDSVGLGSFVETDKGLFYIAVSLGKVAVDAKDVFVISPVSPLATALKGLRAGDGFEFNKLHYSIRGLQ